MSTQYSYEYWIVSFKTRSRTRFGPAGVGCSEEDWDLVAKEARDGGRIQAPHKVEQRVV
jgi:hypothetical protein